MRCLLYCLLLCAAVGLVPLNVSNLAGKSVLFLSAHPDDIESCAGGLIQLLTKVSYVIVTNGDKGCSNSLCQNMSSAELAEERAKEQMAAALVLGVSTKNVHMLNYEDAMVLNTPRELIYSDLVAIVRRIQPDVIFSW
jgi:LmbE family N-acetylglucosaminyl deacetylase